MKQIIQKSAIRVLCPECFLGYSRPALLYKHFRDKGDTIHEGLDAKKSDFEKFLSTYKEVMGARMLPDNLRTQNCFEIMFVVENYKKDDPGSLPITSAHS